MPNYLFSNPNPPFEIKEIFQHMNDIHEYQENGVKWQRIFCKPQASINTQIDPFDHRKGIEKIGSTKGTIGNMQDFAAEQSAKRTEKIGDIEPLKKKQWSEYEKLRGRKCIEERKHNLNKQLKEVKTKIKKKLN